MTPSEIMGYLGAIVGGILVVLRLVDTYTSERRKAQAVANAQEAASATAAQQVARMSPVADMARIEGLIADVRSDLAEIKREVRHIRTLNDEEKRDRDADRQSELREMVRELRRGQGA